MKLSDFLSRTGLKCALLTYIFVSITYIGIQVYTTGTSPARTARRSVLEPDTFFVAPLTQNVIEQEELDELDECKQTLHLDYQVVDKKGTT